MLVRKVGAIRATGVVAAVAAPASPIADMQATAAAVDPQTLVGAWSGPATIGNTGECGNGSAEYAFAPNGTYRYAAAYDGCAPAMVDGHYELQADGGVLQLSMELCGAPGCPDGPTVLTTPITTPNPDTFVLDSRYTYQREHG
jgi:hypothetical protein